MGGKSQTSTSQSTTTPQNLAGLQSIFNQVQGAASTPYTPYGGQLTAGINNQQNLGIAGINAGANSAQPYYNTAAGYAGQAGAPISASAIQNYQNPYTQSVIDATQAQFNEGNGIQQQQVKGNAALAGALGGSRQAVAQAETARQQQLAQAPVIAGLNQANYTQALGAAQADRSAAGNAAGLYGNLGTAAQTAALQGAGAQIGAGTLQQQTQQAGLDAQYQQYLQAQGFPYAQAQFFSQYGLPAATAQGASTSGTQTTPGPNPWTQALGLGTAALTAFSDERVKENIEKVGKTFDGQHIYRFNYRGNPMTQIGLIAQDVEQKHPDAVGESGGVKTVNYSDATDDAAQRGRFAKGGIVGNDSPFNFIANGVDFIPKGGGAPSGQLNAPSLQFAKPADNNSNPDAGRFLGTAAHMFGNQGGGSGGWGATGTGAEGVGSLGGLYADGGLVDAIHHIHSTIKRSRGGNVRRFADGGATFDDRFSAAFPMSAPDTPAEEPFRLAGPDAMDAWRKGVDTPNPAIAADDAPPIAPSQPSNPMLLPPQITGPQEEEPTSALAFDSTGRGPAMSPGQAPQGGAAAPVPESRFGSFNPFGLSDKAREALISGALGVAASRSPFALSAIGEGGLHGMKAYSAATAAEQEAADKKISQAQNQRRVDMEAQRIAQSASQFAKTNSQAERRLKLAEDKTPEGYRATKDGSYEPIPGGPADPEMIRKATEAKRSNSPMADETADFLAERVLSGDTRALIGLGRGAQGAENLTKIQGLVAAKAKERGLDPTDILAKAAEQSGVTASQRTFGTQTARMAINATEAQGAIELGRTASAAVPRTKWVPVNKAIQAYQAGTSDPALAKFGAANLAIVNTYARAISPTGVPTVHDKEHAEKLLSTATSQEAYSAVLDQMNEEIKIAHSAAPKAKKELEDIRKGRTSEPAPAAAAAIPAAPKGIPAGSAYSPSRKQWKAPDGQIYNADGSKT
jgi:hypothetical protein